MIVRQCTQGDLNDIKNLYKEEEETIKYRSDLEILSELDKGSLFGAWIDSTCVSVLCINIISPSSYCKMDEFHHLRKETKEDMSTLFSAGRLILYFSGSVTNKLYRNSHITMNLVQHFVKFCKFRFQQFFGKMENFPIHHLTFLACFINGPNAVLSRRLISSFVKPLSDETSNLHNKNTLWILDQEIEFEASTKLKFQDEQETKGIVRSVSFKRAIDTRCKDIDNSQWIKILEILNGHILPRNLDPTSSIQEFKKARLSRNLYKLNHHEQDMMLKKRIGIIGLSAGFHVLQCMVMSGVGGYFKIADPDVLDLSNLNRLPFSVNDIDFPKTTIAAKKMLEIDPYLNIETFHEGITEDNMDVFLKGLDLVVEECDSLYIKVLVRIAAKKLQIPVIMVTSDRGRIDIERYDLEPFRPIFHGKLDDVFKSFPNYMDKLRIGDSTSKVEFLSNVLGFENLSDRLIASLLEMDSSVNSWSQLAQDVVLGGAQATNTAIEIFTGKSKNSGVFYTEFTSQLKSSTTTTAMQVYEEINNDSFLKSNEENVKVPSLEEMKNFYNNRQYSKFLQGVIDYAKRSPSGGNIQPWLFSIDDATCCLKVGVDLSFRDSLDPLHRGKFISVGAVVFSIISIAQHLEIPYKYRVHKNEHEFTFVADKVNDDSSIGKYAPCIMSRHTDRSVATIGDEKDKDSINQFMKLFVNKVLFSVCNRQLVESIGRMDRVRFMTPSLRSGLLQDITFDEKSLTGVDIRTFGTSISPAIFKLYQQLKVRPSIFDAYANEDSSQLGKNNIKECFKLFENTPFLGLIYIDNVKQNQTSSWIEVGMLLQHMSLYATANKIGINIIGAGIFIMNSLNDGKITDVPRSLIPDVENFKACIADNFNMDFEKYTPALLFRIFPTQNYHPLIRSSRRHTTTSKL